MDVTVLMATYRRPELLARTLGGYDALEDPGATWRLLVIDNAGDEETRGVVSEHAATVPVEYLAETGPGKNRALNHGLAHATGDLYVFTDDDAVPRRDWLRQLVEGAARWPDVTMFGGRIDPIWPGETLREDLDNPFVRGLLTITSWGDDEGPMPWNRVWGPNMAVRAHAFGDGTRFDPGVGPTPREFMLGGEVDLTKRLAARGHQTVYLPDAIVGHQIRPEQLDEAWLARRSFRLGRGVARLQGVPKTPRIAGAPRFLYRELLSAGRDWLSGGLARNAARRCDGRLRFSFSRGKLVQFRAMTRKAGAHE